MLKKKAASDQAIDGKQSIQGQDDRQLCTRGFSSLTHRFSGILSNRGDEW
jgi:hypothetical protein